MTNPHISAVASGSKVALIFDDINEMDRYAKDYINDAYKYKRLGPAAREYQIGVGHLRMIHTQVRKDFDLAGWTITNVRSKK